MFLHNGDSYKLSHLYIIMFNVSAHQINPILALARIFCTRHVIDVFFVIECPITEGKIIFFQ